MDALASKVVCGQFYWQFQNVMHARAERAKAARTRTVKACWPLSFVRTVFVCAVILAMCSSSDSHIGSGQIDNPGVYRENKKKQKKNPPHPQFNTLLLHYIHQCRCWRSPPDLQRRPTLRKESKAGTSQSNRADED